MPSLFSYSSLFLWIAVLAILVIAAPILRTFLKGKEGEAATAAVLSHLPEDKYVTINNVMLQTEHGTSQIDHVVVSLYGIFVIETKNYKGQIYGSAYGDYWTKNVYGHKYSFYNPIKQNYGHVHALEKLTGYPAHYFLPIVVFDKNTDLKIGNAEHVIHTDELPSEIIKYTEEKLSPERMQYIAELIRNSNIDSFRSRREHVARINKKYGGRNHGSTSTDRLQKDLIRLAAGIAILILIPVCLNAYLKNIPGNKGAVSTASGAGSSEIVITNPNNGVSAASDQNIESQSIADSVIDESKDSISSDSTVLQVFDSDISAGNYIAGKDIPEGTYDFTLVSGTGNVMTNNYSTGNVNVIFGADSPAYVKELKEVKMEDGAMLRIMKSAVIHLHTDTGNVQGMKERKKIDEPPITLVPGSYQAGKDIPAGIYDVAAVSGEGQINTGILYEGGMLETMGTKDSEYVISHFKNLMLTDGYSLLVTGVTVQLQKMDE
jgi:hypothetical protein